MLVVVIHPNPRGEPSPRSILIEGCMNGKFLRWPLSPLSIAVVKIGHSADYRNPPFSTWQADKSGANKTKTPRFRRIVNQICALNRPCCLVGNMLKHAVHAPSGFYFFQCIPKPDARR